MASDDVIVETYDTETGVVTVHKNHTLKFYHWGAAKSPGDKYGGADMRGEVIMLTRNIQIIGEDVDGWGAHIVTSDTAEISDDGTVKERIGNLYLDWVEMHNLSQIDSDRASVRWENAALGNSEVTNCSIHNGLGWGIQIKQSNNVKVKDSRIYNFRPVGVNMENVKNVTFDRNVVAHIAIRETTDVVGEVLDEEGGVVVCTLGNAKNKKCDDIRVTNNIVAGAHWVGMIVQGYKCGKPELSNHFGNVIHSVALSMGGYGAAIHPNYGDKE